MMERVVVKESKHHVIEEDDGFRYRRKRKATHGDPEPAAERGGEEAGPSKPASRARPAATTPPADVDPTVPEFLRPLLSDLAHDGTHQERLIGLCKAISRQISETLEQYRHAMPDKVDFEGLKSAYSAILARWVERVTAAVGANEVLFPGDIEAGGDPGELDEEARAAMLRALKERLEREEREWEALGMGEGGEEKGRAERGRREAVDKAREAAKASSQAGRLGRAYEEAHRQAAVMVDGLSGMLEGVEGALQRAERACTLLQSRLVESSFGGLAHLDSPAALIQKLTRRD